MEEKQDCLGDAAPKTMKSSNDNLKAGRQSSSGAMDFVVRIWSNRFKFKLATVIGCLAGPVNDNFAERLRVMRKTGSMVQHLIGLASGVIPQRVAGQVFGHVQSPELLRALEIDVADGRDIDAFAAKENAILFKRILILATNLVKYWLLAVLHEMMSLPEMFVLLLSDDEALRKRGLEHAQRLEGWMRSGEALAHRNSFVDGLMKNWHWPRLQWVREILVSLSEFGFRCVPPDVYQACEGRFFGFNQTVIIENAMQMFEAISHDSKNRMVCRKQRWRTLQTTHLLEDYDHTPIVPSLDAAEHVGPKLHKSFFEPKHREFSLSSENLRGISAPSWSSPSPQTWDAVPLIVLALEHMDGDWTKLEHLWPSLLVPEGRALFEPGTGLLYYILQVSRFGYLSWPLQMHEDSSKGLFICDFVSKPKDGKDTVWEFGAIEDLGKWKVLKMRLTTPPPEAGERVTARGLVLTADGAAETLLQGAARLSFPNMTVPMLDKLHKHLEVPIVGRRPTSENALLLALIQHALPGIEIEEVRAIIARRNKKELEECSSELADPGVLELIAHIAAPEDVQDIRDYLKKANGKRGGETTASTGAGSSMDHLRAPQIPAIERGVLGGDEEVSVEEYRKYLPFVVGCTLIKEEMWHLRFKVTYKEKPEPPFTFSRCWDPTQEGSCRRAVLACLTWVWTEHEKLGFEPCPWNFEP